MYKVIITKNVNKSIEKIEKSNPQSAEKIITFLVVFLPNVTNPKNLKSATKIQGEKDKYRWRVGDYRIIGFVKDKILTIEIIKIDHRQGAYKK